MKKILKLICFILFFTLSGIDAEAQVYDRRGQTIYVELGGSAFVYSLNYETRFSEKTEGLGGRIGISYLSDWMAIPVNINYLFGKKDKSHFLELGAGMTYFIYPEPEMLGGKNRDSQIMGAFTIMYRLHPRYGKFFFKIGLTPLIGYFSEDQETIESIPMFGVAFGRAF